MDDVGTAADCASTESGRKLAIGDPSRNGRWFRQPVWIMGLLLALLMPWLVRGVDLLPGRSVAQPREPEFTDVSTFTDTDESEINAWLRDQLQLAKFPSMSVAVVRKGVIVYRGAFGFEDVRTKKSATPDTMYHVASITKVFTASLAVMLAERGIVDLDDPVVKYLPAGVSISSSPSRGAKITLRQLASHTSGLPRGVHGAVQSVDEWYQLEPQRLYDLLAQVPLESDPGANEEYSNLGFGLLGHTLERAAGVPIDRLLQEMICQPLQLTRTAIPVDDSLQPATGYDGSGWRHEREESLRERLAGSGGLVTTVDDLARFLIAQLQPGVFSKEMISELQTPTKLLSGVDSGTALGWTIRRNESLGRVLEKNGGRGNCSAWIGCVPEAGVGVAVVSNCGGPDVDPIGRWLLERSVPGGIQPVTKHGYAKVAPYTGVRWEHDRPIVRVNERWSPLVSINGVPIEQILQFTKAEFGERARKRLAEDLVEVLSRMGHVPEWTVRLGLMTADGQVQEVSVRMTEEKRKRVRELE
jgi:D-alanyl-D-alanine-carboxypeptidase/D-alanyl-D-alanine-endopeptidase